MGEKGDSREGDVDPKRKPSSLYVAWVEWIERGILMSSKRGELPEQCVGEHRGTMSLSHPHGPWEVSDATVST